MIDHLPDHMRLVHVRTCSTMIEVYKTVLCMWPQVRISASNTYFNGEQHRQKLPLVSDQHGVTNQRHGLLHCILGWNRRDVLPSCCDDQL